MVQRTPLGFPYVEPADNVNGYPPISQELALLIEKMIQPLHSDAGFSVAASGSGISVFSCVALMHRPGLVKMSVSWTQGSTAVAAGDANFWVGSVNMASWRPLRITTGTLRKNAGGGIVQLAPDGKLEIKWVSSTLAAAHTCYADLTYEVAPVLSALAELRRSRGDLIAPQPAEGVTG